MNLSYLLFDIKRLARNRRVLIFSILMPVVLFLVFGLNLKGQTMDRSGMSAIAYVMVSMAMFGSMSAAMSSGGAIAAEREGGWNRTLRLTPLKPQTYILSKVMLSLALAIPPLLIVFVTGMIGGVRMSGTDWILVALCSWLGALPFAGLGLIIGYIAKPDSVQPITGLVTMLIAAFGGLWYPVDQMPHLMKTIAQLTPAYWTGLTARSPLTNTGFDSQALWVVLGWTVVLGAIALRRFRADTARA
jgi:ABC-2 type transport system permease protein